MNKYPELLAFINSDSPNINLLREPLSYHYWPEKSEKPMTALQICSWLNKMPQLITLGLNDKIENAIKLDDYLAIRIAAKNGHTEVIQHLESHLSTEEKIAAVKADNYFAIRYAAENGHTEVIQHLESHLSTEEKIAAVKADNYFAIRYAAENGHKALIQYLESHLSTEEKIAAVKADNYAAIRYAAKNGHSELIQYLESHLSTEEKIAAVKADNYFAIRNAANNGHKALTQYLESHLTTEEKKAAVKAYNYAVIRDAAKNGHRELIQYLESHLTTEEKIAAIKAYDYAAISEAAKNDHKALIQYLESHLTTEEKIAAIKADDYAAIRNAANNGHKALIQYLESHLTTEEKKEAVKADDYAVIQYAAENGHRELIQYLESHLSTEEKKEAIKACDYAAIREAAYNGHKALIQYLESHLSAEEKKEAIKACDYAAIREAAYSGHKELIQYIESHLTTEEKKEAVKADNYAAIRDAAKNGHKALIQYLESRLSTEEKIAAVKAFDYFAIRIAAKNGDFETMNYFLSRDLGLAYAELHEHEYGVKFVHPFIDQMLSDFQQEKEKYEQVNHNGVFDLPEQASLAFYMLRNLIRRGEGTSDKIRFLLSIPSIRNLCHQQMTVEGGENELLRLALRIGNTEATTLLLQLPEVLRLAEQQNFYQDGDIDDNLRNIAQDIESSMIALSEAEREVVEQLKACYQKPETSYLKVFDAFKEELEARYASDPASIQLTAGHYQVLPLEWKAFQQLNLKSEDYQNALLAYHRHEVHTAYRYLSKPNPWMAPDASYVYVYFDEQGQETKLRYSTFEEYRLLIALLYLAAFDKDTPAIDGYTLEDRENHFIKALALIGRAHNWDKSRLVVLNDIVQCDSEGRPKTEEYDDLQEGDKPSCYSGVLRRLMQAVLGHGLFKVLTSQLIKQTLNEYIRSYFDKVIGPENAVELEKAYQGLINLEGNIEEHQQCLKSINIPENTKQEMMQQACEQLEKTYKSQFTTAKRKAAFEKIMSAYLNSGKISGIDFISFQSLLSLESLLEEKVQHAQRAKPPLVMEASLSDDNEQPPKQTLTYVSFFNSEKKLSNEAKDNKKVDHEVLSQKYS